MPRYRRRARALTSQSRRAANALTRSPGLARRLQQTFDTLGNDLSEGCCRAMRPPFPINMGTRALDYPRHRGHASATFVSLKPSH
jgi:hypothetical protein